MIKNVKHYKHYQHREKNDPKDRNRKRAGFTLAETLLAVLILLLVSVIVVTGIPAAKEAYEKIVLGSNAQVLLSTTVEALRGELGTAWDVKATGTTITYYSGDTGNRAQISSEGNAITVQKFSGEDDETAKTYPLVSAAASTNDLYATYESASVSDGVVTINGLKVVRSSNGNEIVKAGGDGTIVIQAFADAADIDTMTDDETETTVSTGG